MNPTKKITDRSFRYVPAAKSDIRQLFRRVRAEQKAAAEQAERDEAERQDKVRGLKRGRP